ncbi:MAG: Re/Si-specific NAD(P)(+) transhydrogenase subunit alpha [Myxococcota bacterium]
MDEEPAPMLTVFVPRETAAGETRVAMSPAAIKPLNKRGVTVRIEAGAGASAHFGDDELRAAGAEIVPTAEAGAAMASAEIVLKVAPPSADEVAAMGKGAILISFADPYREHDRVRQLRDRGISCLAMELVPRISRAQSMDALSSQASIAGYKAALLVAANLDKYCPLLMTAAGTIKPARIVVMGAGVAGLQAVATARRLGAIVEVSDIRPAVKEEVESLGGKFIDLPMKESGEGEGGYARQVSADFLRKQQEIVAEHVRQADAVITTALVPGRKAPVLVTEKMVENMRDGAVILDMAVAMGGNCALSEQDQDVIRHGVLILGPSNLPATMPRDASMVYSRNLVALLQLLVDKDGNLSLDLSDEIIAGALLTHDGAVRNQRVAEALGDGPKAGEPNVGANDAGDPKVGEKDADDNGDRAADAGKDA